MTCCKRGAPRCPPEAPNRFIINIQPQQIQPLRAFFARSGVSEPALYPMVRGRLVKINDRTVSSADYTEDRARRLIDREFNLSWAARMQSDNRPHGRPMVGREEAGSAILGRGRDCRDARHRARRRSDVRRRRHTGKRARHQSAQSRLGHVQREFLRRRAARHARAAAGELRDQLLPAARQRRRCSRTSCASFRTSC